MREPQRETQRAFEDVGDLLVLMAVLGHNGAFAQRQTGKHGSLTIDKLAIDEGVEFFDGNLVEAGVLQLFVVCQVISPRGWFD